MNNLRTVVQNDVQLILGTDFSNAITVTPPSGIDFVVHGFTKDISQSVDPDTGQSVTGRTASVSLPISLVLAEGHGFPQGISDDSQKPWVVSFDNAIGETLTFKVSESMPDRTLGVVVCFLEVFNG